MCGIASFNTAGSPLARDRPVQPMNRNQCGQRGSPSRRDHRTLQLPPAPGRRVHPTSCAQVFCRNSQRVVVGSLMRAKACDDLLKDKYLKCECPGPNLTRFRFLIPDQSRKTGNSDVTGLEKSFADRSGVISPSPRSSAVKRVFWFHMLLQSPLCREKTLDRLRTAA